ncbi:MAG: phosphoribosylglycinamide formyltransferase [Bacteroidota bacterium]
MKRIAIFCSGSGSNAEAIMKRFYSHPGIRVGLLLSNKPDAYALERAKKYGVPTMVFNRQQFTQTDEVLQMLRDAKIDVIVLAGFLWLVPQNLLTAFPDRILNIHPALLPQFGGKGMHGIHVHKAVKAAHRRESGISIHLVNEVYDSGKILLQKKIPVSLSDSPEQIAANVLRLEHKYYSQAIEDYINALMPVWKPKF